MGFDRGGKRRRGKQVLLHYCVIEILNSKLHVARCKLCTRVGLTRIT